MLRRLLPVLLGLALTLGLAGPASAATHRPLDRVGSVVAPSDLQTPPPDCPCPYTVDQLKARLIGTRIGPGPDTYGGQFTIIGWTADGKYWQRQRSGVTCPSCELVGADGVHPDGLPNWANPTKWNWHAILGDVWDAIWNSCTKGSLVGTGKTASGVLIANLIARGGAVTLGPYGYAAIAIGGCIFGAVH